MELRTSAMRSFKQKPNQTLSLIDPVLEKTCGSNNHSQNPGQQVCRVHWFCERFKCVALDMGDFK